MSDHVHVSDLRWDRLLAGELSRDANAEVLAAADACPACAERLATLTRESEGFAQRPPLQLAAPRARRWWLAAPAVLAAAAAIALVVRTRTEPGPSDERVKGGPVTLVVAAGAPGSMNLVASGDRVHPGDSVQVGYSATRAGYGAVLARDGSNAVSTYVPYRRDVMIELPAGEQQLFPESTVLDAVLGNETLIVLWCERSHELAPLLAELAARDDVEAPTGCTLRRVVLAKEAR